LADNGLVAGTIVCGVCGTVNVGVFARCIACGQELGRAIAADESDSDTASREKPDVPLHQTGEIGSMLPPPIRPAPPPPPPQPVQVAPPPAAMAAPMAATPSVSSSATSTSVEGGRTGGRPPSTASRLRSQQADDASKELDSAAYRQTVVEMPKSAETAQIKLPRVATVVVAERPPKPGKQKSPRESPTSPVAPDGAEPGTKFVARLLLPEGDRRAVEIGKSPLVLGSGLDECGLPGDPRAAASEAKIVLADGRLWIEPSPGAMNVYRRIDREMRLADGDTVLMGDVAATFTRAEAGGAMDGSRQVLGGSANAACGRLVFLRRDGSPGPVHDLPAGKTVVGRTDGHLNFPNDSRLSRRHALFFASDQGVTLEDMDSRNGTYLRIRERQELRADDALRVGSAGVQIRIKS
jgi:hypothetical protein